MEKNKNKQMPLQFLQLNPFLADTIEKPIEKEITGKDYIIWGLDNLYPQYLWDLYQKSSTLQAAINSCVNYILGDEIVSTLEYLNPNDTIDDILELITKDYVLYGGFALNILRNKFGGIAEVHYLDFKNIRTDKKHTRYWYSEDWFKGKWGRTKVVEYPPFRGKDINSPSSIYYVSNSRTTVYPIAFWGSATVAVEAETRINEYNLNQIINGFAPSYIINMNNGLPSDEVKDEIERGFNDKFCGNENAGRMVIAYNDDKEHATSIEALPEDKNVDKYIETVKRAREVILTAFRLTPNLAGIVTENLGFNSEEYSQAFKLFSRTVIAPLQKKISREITRLYPNSKFKIKPFSIEFDDTKKEEITVDEEGVKNE